MGSVSVRYRWRYFCEIRQKMITTRAAFEEWMIKADHPDAVPVEGSRVEARMPDNPFDNCTSGFLKDAPLPNWISERDGKKMPPDLDS